MQHEKALRIMQKVAQYGDSLMSAGLYDKHLPFTRALHYRHLQDALATYTLISNLIKEEIVGSPAPVFL